MWVQLQFSHEVKLTSLPPSTGGFTGSGINAREIFLVRGVVTVFILFTTAAPTYSITSKIPG